MFQSLNIEFVPLDPEFAMLTARPPFFSLQLFDTLILLHAISIFPLNRIVIKFGNKARRRNTQLRLMFLLRFFRAVAASCLLYNWTKYSKDFFIC